MKAIDLGQELQIILSYEEAERLFVILNGEVKTSKKHTELALELYEAVDEYINT